MVRRNPQRDDRVEAERVKKEYSLEDCKQAVRLKQYNLSHNAAKEIAKLGSSPYFSFAETEMEEVILGLKEVEYRKSILYKDCEYWHDVYTTIYPITYEVNGEQKDDCLRLYFKFYMRKESLFVEIMSFHEQR